MIVCSNLQSKHICSHQHAVLRLGYKVILTKMPTIQHDNFVFYECLLCVLNTETPCGAVAPDIHSNIPNSTVLPSVFLGKRSSRAPLSILIMISMDS